MQRRPEVPAAGGPDHREYAGSSDGAGWAPGPANVVKRQLLASLRYEAALSAVEMVNALREIRSRTEARWELIKESYLNVA